MTMKINPLHDRVVIFPNEVEKTTQSGLLIPDNAKEKPQRGIVKAIGTDKMSIKVGDTVLYGRYAGTEIELDGEKLLIMRENEILAIIS